MFTYLRAARRFTHLVVLSAWAVVRIKLTPRLRADKAARSAYLQRWSGKFVRALGIKVVVYGTPPTGKGLLVPNHLGLPDGQIIASIIQGTPVIPVAKKEVGRIPLLGLLAGEAGSILVERSWNGRVALGDVRHSQGKVAHRIDRHGQVLVFLEGTTGSGDAAENAKPVVTRNGSAPRVLSTEELLPFKAPLLEAALEIGHPVTPVTLVVEDEAQRRQYVSPFGRPGKDVTWSLLGHRKPFVIHVFFGTPRVLDKHIDARTHAAALRAEILATYRKERAHLNGVQPLQSAA